MQAQSERPNRHTHLGCGQHFIIAMLANASSIALSDTAPQCLQSSHATTRRLRNDSQCRHICSRAIWTRTRDCHWALRTFKHFFSNCCSERLLLTKLSSWWAVECCPWPKPRRGRRICKRNIAIFAFRKCSRRLESRAPIDGNERYGVSAEAREGELQIHFRKFRETLDVPNEWSLAVRHPFSLRYWKYVS